MFGTVLRDVYRSTEREEMRAAIDDLCSPTDNLLWASTGLYAYFDPSRDREGQTGEHLLYIGLARDLSDRFAAHNGLRAKDGRGNKHLEMTRWFQEHEYLGISLLPQSPLAQVNTYRVRSGLKKFKPDQPGPMVDNPTDGQYSIEHLEGQLIETYRQRFGRRPSWNKMGGDVGGQRQAATGSAYGLLRLIDGSSDGLLCARRPIRSLSSSATYGFFESDALHLARFYAILTPDGATDAAIRDALALLRDSPVFGSSFMEQLDRIKTSGYLELPPDPARFDVISWAIGSE